MSWLIVLLGYLIGSIPTGYIAGRTTRGIDIRRTGDENVGAANVFRNVGAITGIAVGLIDAAKGAVAVLIAQWANVSQPAILLTGAAAVIGHNWPVFIGFRGGRGASTTVGVLYALLPVPMLILTAPALAILFIKKNTIAACAFAFILLPLVSWWLGVPWLLIAYGMALPCLVGLTHFLRTRPHAKALSTKS